MEQKSFITKSFLFILLYVSYVIASVSNTNFYANIISITLNSFSSLILLLCLRKISTNKSHWFALFLVLLSYVVSDTLWFYHESIAGSSENLYQKLFFLYFLPNIFLMISVSIHFIKNILLKNRFQLLVDALSVFSIILIILWSTIFINQNHLDLHSFSFIRMMLLLFTHFYIIIGLFIFFSLKRGESISMGMLFSILAILFYNFTDLLMIYIDLSGNYTSNSLIDYFYYLILAFFSFSSMVEVYLPNWTFHLPSFRRKDRGKVGFFLFFSICCVLFFFRLLLFPALLLCLLILTLHQIVSSYIDVGLRNESLLEKERDLKKQLDQTVYEKTRELEEANQKLIEIIRREPFTGLYDRFHLIRSMDELGKKKSPFSLFFMDIDKFKSINDIYGYEVGDRLLLEITKRLQLESCPSDMLFRLEADEFCLLVTQDLSSKDLHRICQKMIDVLAQPFHIQSYRLRVQVSVGAATFPYDATTALNILRYANIAKATAKNSTSEHRYYITDQPLKERVEREHALEVLLKTINFSAELILHYQPVFSIPDNRLIGMEALLRWHNPGKGFISPNEFIPIAEKSNLIGEIGDYVIQTAMEQIVRWNSSNSYKISINVSPQQFENRNFVRNIKDYIEKYQLNPAWIDLEITERSAMHTSNQTQQIFDELHQYGVNISIDDFGTGYSSLSYINMFHIDRIKIAKELIDNIERDPADRALVRSIILMAQGMKLKTVAEGVETQWQYDILNELGCYSIQGYFLGRPFPAEEFEKRFMTSEIFPDQKPREALL